MPALHPSARGTCVPYLRAANCRAHRTPLHCCSIPLTVQTRQRCRNHWMALPCSVLQRRRLRVHREAAFFAKEPACVPVIWRTPRHRRHHTCRWYSTTQGGAMNLTDCKMHLHGRCVAAAAAAAAAAEVAAHGHAASGEVHRGCSMRAGANSIGPRWPGGTQKLLWQRGGCTAARVMFQCGGETLGQQHSSASQVFQLAADLSVGVSYSVHGGSKLTHIVRHALTPSGAGLCRCMWQLTDACDMLIELCTA
jgi:hypothetical protein